MATHSKEQPNPADDAKRSLVSLARLLVPMVEGYGRSKEAEAARKAACDPEAPRVCEPSPIQPGKPAQFSADERRAYGMAFARLLAEGGDLLANGELQTDEGQLRSVSFDKTTGEYPAPSLAFALAAVQKMIAPKKRYSMEMSMLPDSAPMSSVSQPVKMVRSQWLSPAAASSRPSRSTPVMQSSGCGCGRPKPGHGDHSCSTKSAPAATRGPDGKCEPDPFEISCETQIRLKQCLKLVLCEFLRCLERRLCVNGSFQWNLSSAALLECLGEAICTLLHCVPDALCPPPEADSSCCTTNVSPGYCLPCNFAVEETNR